jgi:hypothetical protein
MRILSAALAVLLLGTVHGGATDPLGATVTVVQLPSGATVEGGAGAAVAELGTVSGHVRATANGISIVSRARSYVVSTFIGLRVASSRPVPRVSLEAFLDAPLPGIVVRFDGVVLTGNPAVFATGIPLNLVTRHHLEVEIPSNMPVVNVPSEIPLQFGAVVQ